MPEVTVPKKSSRILASTHVDWRAVRAFLAVAFGLAWTIEGAALALGVRFTALTPKSTALLASVMLVPALAALVVLRFVTYEGFATAGLRRGPWRPYLFVWIGVPLLLKAYKSRTDSVRENRWPRPPIESI